MNTTAGSLLATMENDNLWITQIYRGGSAERTTERWFY
jgi:hypothetical protein